MNYQASYLGSKLSNFLDININNLPENCVSQRIFTVDKGLYTFHVLFSTKIVRLTLLDRWVG